MKKHADSIDDIAVGDAGIFMDIDQPKDVLQQPWLPNDLGANERANESAVGALVAP